MSRRKPAKEHRTLCDITRRFAERTSVTGPSYIATSRHLMSKAIWFVFFLGAIGMTVYMVTINFTRYFSWPIQTGISLGYAELPFPMVTICNTNPFRLSTMDIAGEDLAEFVSNLNPESFARSVETTTTPVQTTTSNRTGRVRNKRFINRAQRERIANLSDVPTNYFDYYDEDFSEERAPIVEVEQEANYLFSQLPRATRVEMGHQLDDMLLYCSFEGRECTQKDFTLFQTSDYGNCYKFNEASNGSNVRIARRTGQTFGVGKLRGEYLWINRIHLYNGLQLILYTEVDEYIPGLALGYGMRLVLSMHNTLPPVTSEGMYISAGAETSIGLQLTNISRLGSPYGNCSTDGGNSMLNRLNLTYTRTACQEMCESYQVYNKCGCYQSGSEEMYPEAVLSSTRPCKTSDLTCINDLKRDHLTNIGSCLCPTACREFSYKPTLSSREWPEAKYMNSLIDGFCTDSPKDCDRLLMKSDAERRRNFVKVNVFYRDLNYETISEGSDYPHSSFFSDLGGAIGLWVGFSILGLLEVLQFLLEICYGLLKRCTRSDISAAREDEDPTVDVPDVKYSMSSTKTLNKTLGVKDKGKY